MKWLEREILKQRAKLEYGAERLKRLEAVRALDVPQRTKNKRKTKTMSVRPAGTAGPTSETKTT